MWRATFVNKLIYIVFCVRLETSDAEPRSLAAFQEYYPWIDRDALQYFRPRLLHAPRDNDHGRAVVLEHCRTS